MQSRPGSRQGILTNKLSGSPPLRVSTAVDQEFDGGPDMSQGSMGTGEGRSGVGEESEGEGGISVERSKLEAYLVIQTCIEPGFFMAHPGQAGLDCRRIRAFHRL